MMPQQTAIGAAIARVILAILAPQPVLAIGRMIQLVALLLAPLMSAFGHFWGRETI